MTTPSLSPSENVPATRAPWDIRFIHAVAGFLTLYLLIFNGEETGALYNARQMSLEVVGGLLLTFVTTIRVWRIGARKYRTGLSKTAPAWEHRASSMVQRVSYWLTAMVILSGLSLALLAPASVQVGWLSAISAHDPRWFRVAVFVHSRLAELLALTVLLHTMAALWHLLVRRDAVWSWMMSLRGWRT